MTSRFYVAFVLLAALLGSPAAAYKPLCKDSAGRLVQCAGTLDNTHAPAAPVMSGANITSGTIGAGSITGGSANRIMIDGGTTATWSNTIVGATISCASNTCTNLPASALSGTVGVGNGGTGKNTWTVGAIPVASGVTTIAEIAPGTAGHVLTANGAGVAPSWQAPSVATNSTSSLSSSQYNISATDLYEDIGLSVTLPAAGTYRVWVNLTVGGRITASPNGVITFKLYNSTDAADVSNSERTAPWITQNSVGIVDNVAFEETITVAASKTIKVYAKKNSGPTWTDAYISSGTDARSRIGYVKY